MGEHTTGDDVATLRADLAAARAEADALRAALRGRVAPEVFARAVREAFSLGITTAGASLRVGDVRLESARATWPYSAAAKSLLATLTAAGLTPDEARDVVEGVGK